MIKGLCNPRITLLYKRRSSEVTTGEWLSSRSIFLVVFIVVFLVIRWVRWAVYTRLIITACVKISAVERCLPALTSVHSTSLGATALDAMKNSIRGGSLLIITGCHLSESKEKPHNLILFWSLSRWYALDELPFSRVHPKPAGEGSLGFGIISFFYTIAWQWARNIACFRAALVGGDLSDSACFLRNKNHLCSLTLLIWVPGKYSKHTGFSMAAKVVGRGCEVPPGSARASTQTLSASRNAFQQASLPFPAKLPVTSAPLYAWKPGRAAILAGPRARTMEQRGIFRCRCPLPVTTRVSSHICRSACRLSANTNTSVSGETTSILVAQFSSWLLLCLCAFLYIYYPTPPLISIP